MAVLLGAIMSREIGYRKAEFPVECVDKLVAPVRPTLDVPDSSDSGNARKKRKTNTSVVDNAVIRIRAYIRVSRGD